VASTRRSGGARLDGEHREEYLGKRTPEAEAADVREWRSRSIEALAQPSAVSPRRRVLAHRRYFNVAHESKPSGEVDHKLFAPAKMEGSDDVQYAHHCGPGFLRFALGTAGKPLSTVGIFQ
jgi:hypothetical protein